MVKLTCSLDTRRFKEKSRLIGSVSLWSLTFYIVGSLQLIGLCCDCFLVNCSDMVSWLLLMGDQFCVFVCRSIMLLSMSVKQSLYLSLWHLNGNGSSFMSPFNMMFAFSQKRSQLPNFWIFRFDSVWFFCFFNHDMVMMFILILQKCVKIVMNEAFINCLYVLISRCYCCCHDSW